MKKALVVLAVLALIAAGAAYWAYHSVDLIVKVALEHFGPDVTGVAIKVGDVSISPRDGRGTLKGVEIGNPAGFTSPRAARLGEMSVVIDPATLGAPVILIREIKVESASISYERSARTTNLDAIQKNIEGYIKRGALAQESAASPMLGAKRRFIIERLTIRAAKVTMTNPALKGQGITFDLPDIELRDMGKRQNGITASEAANIVAGTLIARIAQRVLTSVDLLRKGGVEGAVDALKGLLKR